MDTWNPLIQKTIKWATEYDVSKCYARVSVEDEEKISMFESLQFKKVGMGEDFILDERRVHSLYMEKNFNDGAFIKLMNRAVI